MLKQFFFVLALLLQLGARTQTTNVIGKVITPSGEGVPGATVTLKGTSLTTATDTAGRFSLTVAPAKGILVVSAASYQAVEWPLNGEHRLSITLEPLIQALEQVIVHTGYQALPRERATGSFFVIDSHLLNRQVSTGVLARLEGIASSLAVDKRLGTNALTIRGISTLYAGASPLIVVDQFPYEGDIQQLNPNDIASVTILKDAAAASIWGARAGNGVIVITTKKGKRHQPLQVNLVTNLTIAQKPDLYYSPDFLQAASFIEVEQRLFGEGFYDALLTDPTQPAVSPVVELLEAHRNGQLSPEALSAHLQDLRQRDVRKDMSRYFYQRAVNQQYGLNLQGGTAQASYYFSLGQDLNRGSTAKTEYRRFTLQGNFNFQPFRNLEMWSGFNYAQTRSLTDNTLSFLNSVSNTFSRLYPYAALADETGAPLAVLRDYRASFAGAAEANGFLNWQYYPLQELAQGWNRNDQQQYNSRMNTGLRYTFIKGLSAEASYQYQKGLQPASTRQHAQSYYVRNLVNQFSGVTADGRVGQQVLPYGSILQTTVSTSTAQSGRGQLNYNGRWSTGSLVWIGGAEWRETTSNSHSNQFYGFNENTGTVQPVDLSNYYPIYPLNDFARIPSGADVGGNLYRFRSLYTNGAFTYKQRYTLSASARRDGSNLFGVATNRKTVPLWSAGISWQLSEEPLFKKAALPSLKLRATYGYSGNAGSNVSALSTISYYTGAPLTNLPFAAVNNAPNPTLRWEKVAMFNLGLDIATRDNRLSGSLEFYHKKADDLLAPAPLDPTFGFGRLTMNSARLTGKGADLHLITQNLKGALHWETDLLASYVENKVSRYLGAFTTAGLYAGAGTFVQPLEGRAAYALYSFRWAGLDPATGNPRGIFNKEVSQDYNAMWSDSLSALRYHGSAVPVLFGALRNTFSYKGFSVSAVVNYKMGYYFKRSTIWYNALFSSWSGHADYEKRWQQPGDELQTTVPSLAYPANSLRDEFYANSEATVEKGDHIRLQDVRLAYEWRPGGKRLPFSQLQFFIYANNVGILWRANQAGLDPDFAVGYLPATRSFSLGATASF